MIVKMIVTQCRVIFGNRYYKDDYHSDVAARAHIPKSAVLGGGLADLNTRRIFGTSYGFTAYNPKTVKTLLPDWTVDPPSDYD